MKRRHSPLRRLAAGGRWILLLALVQGCRADAAPPDRETGVRRGDDLVASGRVVSIAESVPGDVVVAGGELRFSGNAGGDYLGAGGEQAILGTVAGSVRAAGGEVLLTAQVERNVTLAGGRVELDRGGVVQGNAYMAGGEVVLRGTVNEVLHATGGEVLVDGVVGGDVHVQAGRLHVGPNARITGNLLHSVRGHDVTIDPAAQVGGEVVALPPPRLGWLVALRVAWHLGFLVAGVAFVLLFPGLVTSAGRAVRRSPLAAAGWGLLWVIAVPLVAGVIAVTIIGLPLALMMAVLYMIALYLGRAILAVWLGDRLLRGRAPGGRGGVVVSFLVGGVILLAIGLVPAAGPLAIAIATLIGLGAIMLVLNPRRQRPAEA